MLWGEVPSAFAGQDVGPTDISVVVREDARTRTPSNSKPRPTIVPTKTGSNSWPHEQPSSYEDMERTTSID
jgi:hypothetical protein